MSPCLYAWRSDAWPGREPGRRARKRREREVTRFQEAVRQRLGGRPVEPFELVLAHIDEALNEDDAATRKAAFLVTALVHAPDMMEPARRYMHIKTTSRRTSQAYARDHFSRCR